MDLPPAELQRCKECCRPSSRSPTLRFLSAPRPCTKPLPHPEGGTWDSGESLRSLATELEKRISFACTIFGNIHNKLIFFFFFTLPPGSEGPGRGREFSVMWKPLAVCVLNAVWNQLFSAYLQKSPSSYCRYFLVIQNLNKQQWEGHQCWSLT